MPEFLYGFGVGLMLCMWTIRKWGASEHECLQEYRKLQQRYDELMRWNQELDQICTNLRDQLNVRDYFDTRRYQNSAN